MLMRCAGQGLIASIALFMYFLIGHLLVGTPIGLVISTALEVFGYAMLGYAMFTMYRALKSRDRTIVVLSALLVVAAIALSIVTFLYWSSFLEVAKFIGERMKENMSVEDVIGNLTEEERRVFESLWSSYVTNLFIYVFVAYVFIGFLVLHSYRKLFIYTEIRDFRGSYLTAAAGYIAFGVAAFAFRIALLYFFAHLLMAITHLLAIFGFITLRRVIRLGPM